jgi:hypothetical protein
MTATTQRKRRGPPPIRRKRHRRRTKWYDVERGNVRVPVWAVCDPARPGVMPRSWMGTFAFRRRFSIDAWLRDGRRRDKKAHWSWWSRRGWRCRRLWVRIALVDFQAERARRR